MSFWKGFIQGCNQFTGRTSDDASLRESDLRKQIDQVLESYSQALLAQSTAGKLQVAALEEMNKRLAYLRDTSNANHEALMERLDKLESRMATELEDAFDAVSGAYNEVATELESVAAQVGQLTSQASAGAADTAAAQAVTQRLTTLAATMRAEVSKVQGGSAPSPTPVSAPDAGTTTTTTGGENPGTSDGSSGTTTGPATTTV